MTGGINPPNIWYAWNRPGTVRQQFDSQIANEKDPEGLHQRQA